MKCDCEDCFVEDCDCDCIVCIKDECECECHKEYSSNQGGENGSSHNGRGC